MRKVNSELCTALAVIGMFTMAHIAQAQLISPVDGDANVRLGVGNAGGVSLDDGTWGVGHIVDESGLASLDTNTLHDAMNSGNGGRGLSTGGFLSLIFDLGGTNTLGGVVLWNGGEDDRPGNGRTIAQRDQTDRGVQSAEFFYATDGVGNNTTTIWTSLGTFGFTQEFFDVSAIPESSPGVPDLNSTVNAVGPISAQERTFTVPAADATHIRIDATNWGDPGIVNMSEIAFSAEVSTNAPVFIANPVVKANATNLTDYVSAGQTMAGSATNSAGDTMTYEVVSGPAWLMVASNGDLSGTPDAVGTNLFSIKATTPGLDSAIGTLQITVDPLGNPPVFTTNLIVKADGFFDADYALESQSLTNSATDADLDTLTYVKDGGPAWLIIATNGALSGVCDVAGTNSFPISVDDGNGNTDTATLVIFVATPGNAPEFTSDPIVKANGTVGEDYSLESQTLDGSATDADLDTLSYFKDGGPAWLNIASNGALSGVCTTFGTNSFPISVDDGNGNSDTATLVIFVDNPTPVAPDPDGVVAHWPMDEGTGTTTTNIATNAYHGAINGAIWAFGTGARATFLSFDGTDDNVDPGLMLPLMTTSNDFTWAVWFNSQQEWFPDSGNQRNAIIIGNRKDGSNTDYTPREFTKLTPRQHEWRPNDTADSTQYGGAPLTNWVHVTVVKDGDTLQIYTNGVAAGINTINGFTNAMPFFIGGEAGQSSSEHFNGFIDDVRLYDYALSPAEIIYIVNEGTVGPLAMTGIDRGAVAGDIDVTWTSKVGRAYNVMGASQLGPVDDWAALSGLSNLVATSESTTATVSTVGADVGFYRVEELPVLPIFFDDFESGIGGWTNGTAFGSTEWELGTPAFGAFTNAFSGDNAWGTNLDGEYGEDHKPWLRSPPIDLTAYGNVIIKFHHTRELEVENGNPFDYGRLHILDTNYTRLATNVYVATGMDAAWTEVSRPLPPAVTGQVIVLEFELDSDEYQPSNMAGWHIDDVRIVEP